MSKVFAAIALLAAATGIAWGAEQQDRANLVLTDGTCYVGKVLAMDGSAVTLVTDEGKRVEIDRRKVALINLQPEWVVVKAYGAKDNVYYDFTTGFAVTVPTEGWVSGYDSEGHLFLTSPDGRLALGFYAYISKFASLDDFLTVHATWRKTHGMPETSYTGGADMQVDGQPAKAFVYETTSSGGQSARLLDVKTVSPLGHGLVVALMASGVTEQEFEQLRQSVMPIIQGIHFVRPGS